MDSPEDMLKPLNNRERKAAIYRFLLTGFFTLALLSATVLVYYRMPKLFDSPSRTQPSTNLPQPDTLNSQRVLAIQQKLQAAVKSLRTPYVMLLVDATPGMQTFLPALSEAAREINTISANVTAACYRDAAEGAWLYESSATRNQDPASWLQNLATTVVYDQDEPEAVYYGLREALQSGALPGEATNVLILVGDAGNHAQAEKTKVEPSEIVTLLAAKHCHFAAFQVRHPTSNPALFATQLKEEIMEPALQAMFANKDNTGMKAETVPGGSTLYRDKANQYLLYAVGKKQTLSSALLQKEITGFVENAIREANRQAQKIQDLLEGKLSEDEPQEILSTLARFNVSLQDVQYLQAALRAKSGKELSAGFLFFRK